MHAKLRLTPSMLAMTKTQHFLPQEDSCLNRESRYADLPRCWLSRQLQVQIYPRPLGWTTDHPCRAFGVSSSSRMAHLNKQALIRAKTAQKTVVLVV